MELFKLVHSEQGAKERLCWRACQGAIIQGLEVTGGGMDITLNTRGSHGRLLSRR